ncbi:putative 3-oxoacyl-reductase [Hyaloraphidium curvatum]|nr:putative 3-oxoacyl-reductase [Hyaloraphidium curvatum]
MSTGKRLSKRTQSIEGRVALVTGGASGIGRAVCHVLSDYGAKIAVVDLGQERCDVVVKEINDCHGAGRARGWHCDVRSTAEVQKVTDEVASAFSRIDFLINCAGIGGQRASLEKSSLDEFLKSLEVTVDVNLTGTCRFIATCTPYLVKAAAERPEGVGPAPDGTSRIINIASVAGLFTTGGYGYDASKHAVVGITKTACAELGPKGITTNCICPGLVKTGMTAGAHDLFDDMGKLTPAMRAADPEDIAQVIYHLCTPASGFVNGEWICVDGGWTKIFAANWPYVNINGTWEERGASFVNRGGATGSS